MRQENLAEDVNEKQEKQRAVWEILTFIHTKPGLTSPASLLLYFKPQTSFPAPASNPRIHTHILTAVMWKEALLLFFFE